MTSITLVGIDPGLVDTGLVAIHLDPVEREWCSWHDVASNADRERVVEFVEDATQSRCETRVFIEGYRDRGTVFSTHGDMRQLVADVKRRLPGSTVLDNMGVKKVVRRPLMEALGVWNFPTSTRHQDLRSAARIALLGGLKNPAVNKTLAVFVTDLVEGRPWSPL